MQLPNCGGLSDDRKAWHDGHAAVEGTQHLPASSSADLMWCPCRRRVTTATLNLVVREAVGWRSPPSLRGDPRKGRVYYATQVRRPSCAGAPHSEAAPPQCSVLGRMPLLACGLLNACLAPC